MKRFLTVSCSTLVLVLLFSISAFAGNAEEPVVSPDPGAIFAEPSQVTDPAELSPSENWIFVDVSDDVAYNVCCVGANANCTSSCAGNVRSFSCWRVGARGCSSSCSCW